MTLGRRVLKDLPFVNQLGSVQLKFPRKRIANVRPLGLR